MPLLLVAMHDILRNALACTAAVPIHPVPEPVRTGWCMCTCMRLYAHGTGVAGNNPEMVIVQFRGSYCLLVLIWIWSAL